MDIQDRIQTTQPASPDQPGAHDVKEECQLKK